MQVNLNENFSYFLPNLCQIVISVLCHFFIASGNLLTFFNLGLSALSTYWYILELKHTGRTHWKSSTDNMLTGD